MARVTVHITADDEWTLCGRHTDQVAAFGYPDEYRHWLAQPDPTIRWCVACVTAHWTARLRHPSYPDHDEE